MFVDRLELVDFRSYRGVNLSLGPGVSVLIGPNGHGKTNLVEAVEYLATLASHRVTSDAPLIRAGTTQAIIRASVVAGVDDPRRLLLECELNAGRANRARINRAPLRRVRELIGALRTVVFSPEDLAIVKGDPADRRGFLDALLVTRWPRMAGVKADYDRAIRQRNALLKSLGGRAPDEAAGVTLDVWNERCAGLGGEILAARLVTLADLVEPVSSAYARIAPVNNVAAAQYKSSLPGLDERIRDGAYAPDDLAQLVLDGMAARRGDEIARGVSLVGPHRDDVTLSIGALPAKGYASHGESWSLALALRLGSLEMLRDQGIEPVLVLDDVFAELDATRRDRLADSVLHAEQVLVTAAVAHDVPKQLQGHQFVVDMIDNQPDTGDNSAAGSGPAGDHGMGASQGVMPRVSIVHTVPAHDESLSTDSEQLSTTAVDKDVDDG